MTYYYAFFDEILFCFNLNEIKIVKFELFIIDYMIITYKYGIYNK